MRCNREENDLYFRRLVSRPDCFRRIAAKRLPGHAANRDDARVKGRAKAQRVG